eukprot:TRINITY_DN111374_c0_g1_i1.p1 TRINITY_DN111374_c0_g1~~TRINITY_DN111374_c0_g1_i1.p1  ORF type:complete len:310 (-),score=74.78 TRINITY_DN111374_c0_g1_i1:169-1098(-)
MADAATMQREASDGNEASAARRKKMTRSGSKDQTEVVDELALETKRTSLLDRLETQLKGPAGLSRMLIGFSVPDDRKIQKVVDQELTQWLQRLEADEQSKLSGLLMFASQAALQFVEGPTELVFKALEFVNSLSSEARASAAAAAAAKEPLSPGAPATGTSPRDIQKDAGLIHAVRVLHFTELHGVRAARNWCSVVHNGKVVGSAQPLEEANCPDLVFSVYKKILTLCVKVQQNFEADGLEDADTHGLQKIYRKNADDYPTVDEVLNLNGKAGIDLFFSFPEFEKVFMAPFQLVLHSELLWPMAPALSY